MFKIKKVHPMFNQVVTTKEKYKEVMTNSGLYDTTRTNHLKEYQTVVAVGPSVREIKPGDVVFINPKRYGVPIHRDGLKDLDKNIQKTNMYMEFDIPTIEVYDRPDGSCRELLLIYDSDVSFVAEGEEFDELGLYKPTEQKLTDTPPTLYVPDYGKKS